MAYNKVSNYATVIGTENGFNFVQYHSTKIVQWNDDEIILDTGGWFTPTTKTKMNQVAHQFDLAFHVYQENGEWYVSQPNNHILYSFGANIRLTFKRIKDTVIHVKEEGKITTEFRNVSYLILVEEA